MASSSGHPPPSYTLLQKEYVNVCNSRPAVRPDPAMLESMQSGAVSLHLDFYSSEETEVLCHMLGKMHGLRSIRLSVGSPPETWGVKHAARLAKPVPPADVPVQARPVSTKLCFALKAALKRSPELEALELPGVRLYPRGMTKLAQGVHSCTRLRRLDFTRCLIGDAGFAAIGDSIRISESLNFLLLQRCGLTPRSVPLLMAVCKQHASSRDEELWARGLRGEDTRGDVARMGLLCLDVADNGLGDVFGTAFGQFLPHDNWLQAVRACRNGFTTAGAKALLEGLLGNERLFVLDVRDCNDCDPGTLVAVERVCAARRVPPPDTNAMLWRELIQWNWPYLEVMEPSPDPPVRCRPRSASTRRPRRTPTTSRAAGAGPPPSAALLSEMVTSSAATMAAAAPPTPAAASLPAAPTTTNLNTTADVVALLSDAAGSPHGGSGAVQPPPLPSSPTPSGAAAAPEPVWNDPSASAVERETALRVALSVAESRVTASDGLKLAADAKVNRLELHIRSLEARLRIFLSRCVCGAGGTAAAEALVPPTPSSPAGNGSGAAGDGTGAGAGAGGAADASGTLIPGLTSLEDAVHKLSSCLDQLETSAPPADRAPARAAAPTRAVSASRRGRSSRRRPAAAASSSTRKPRRGKSVSSRGSRATRPTASSATKVAARRKAAAASRTASTSAGGGGSRRPHTAASSLAASLRDAAVFQSWQRGPSPNDGISPWHDLQ